jgi:HD-GYP domain-containing protein (c-di-GMP phosphodiesterase class II)
MILGDNLYNNNGELLLSRGLALSIDYLKSIHRLKYNGIYIEDDISKDIPMFALISDTVKAETIKGIKDIYIHSEQNKADVRKDMKSIKLQADKIVEEILSNRSTMFNIIDMKVYDDYTYYHSVNVAVLSVVIGMAIDMDREELGNLGLAALLHDIGKVFIDKDVLNIPGQYKPDEYEEMKKHSLLGCDYLKKQYCINDRTYMGILDHHEKYGGGGYPNNIKGVRISLYGRIINIADVYDALTSDRPYRKALIPSEAMEYIMGASMNLFDPKIVEVFAKKIAAYPIGTCVKLSNGLSGIVIDNFEDYNLRPKLRIFKDQELDVEPYEMELANRDFLNVTITEVI